MVDIFREQVDEFSIQMPELLAKSDYENLSRVAHKAKSSVAVMGMTKEAELLKKLEIDAKTGTDIAMFRDMIKTFIENSGLALEELDDYLKKAK
ncbi:MAG: Hpt domain-containing protein [Bacteroidales bacterium]